MTIENELCTLKKTPIGFDGTIVGARLTFHAFRGKSISLIFNIGSKVLTSANDGGINMLDMVLDQNGECYAKLSGRLKQANHNNDYWIFEGTITFQVS